MASIQGLTDAHGNQLGSSAGIGDVLASPQVAPALLKAVQESFPDITGDEWYASTVGLAVMMGVIGGRPAPDGNGLIFAGDDLVTRAEWMAMVNRIGAYSSYLRDMGDPWVSQPSSDGVVPAGMWFLVDYNLITNGSYTLAGHYTLEELSQPISRAEAAYIFNHNTSIRIKSWI